MDEMERAGCVLVGFDWHDDNAVAGARAAWATKNKPANAVVEILVGDQRGSFKVNVRRK